jgi:hypothetical protein
MPSRQASAILHDLEKHKNLFDLTLGLGTALMNEAAEGMFDQAMKELDPDGAPWPVLSEDYAKAKAKHYPGEQIGEREHLMLTLENFDGERDIETNEATQTFGLSESARQEAEWFIEGSEKQNRPPRRFYELDAATVKRLDGVVEKHGDKRVG